MTTAPDAPGSDTCACFRALDKALDVAIWASGSEDFAPGGKAHEGWVNVMRPKLNEALAERDALTKESSP